MADSDQDSVIPEEALQQIKASFYEEATPVAAEADQFELLWRACERVAKFSNIALTPPTKTEKSQTAFEYLNAMTNASQIRMRKVTLHDQWWQYDSGPLLAFNCQSKKFYALIPVKSDVYECYDPQSGEKQRINAHEIGHSFEEAYFFYRTFPNESIGWRQLFKFSLVKIKGEFWRAVLLQILVSSLGLIIPIITGVLFNYVVPQADINLLFQFVIALLINAVVITAFNFSQILAVMRLELKMNVVAQSALWDRLLRLPLWFFRRFTAGELAFRASIIDQIQQLLTSTMLISLISGGFSIITLCLLFYLDPLIALGVLALALIMAVIEIVAIIVQLKYQRRMYQVRSELSGFLFQLLSNISKLRVAHREAEGFTFWSKKFGESARYFFRANNIVLRLSVFQSSFLLIATLLFFAMVIGRGDNLSFGRFIIFNAAFSQFLVAIFGLMNALSNALQVVPLYERAKPILSEIPEVNKEKFHPGILSGAITMQHLFFRYDNKEVPIFKDLSLHVAAGEFVAIVGPSGAGKSTLFRLLLGFEKLDAGQIFYDDRELSMFNIEEVRKQFGVVLQNSVLMPGTLFENIVGATTLGLDEAWELARVVGIEQEIAAMPMGMQTWVVEGGKTLSMGQRQRILIARALARNPGILLLDEATTAIDNVTQAKIYENLSQLKMTRIVIAHRLATISFADRIYVLNQGEIVQHGSYQQLIQEENGLFSQMIKRQL